MKRKALIEKVKNVFWALFFAIALWLVMVQSEQRPEPATAILTVNAPGVNVKYMTPNGQRPEVQVTLRGSATDLGRVDRTHVEAVYNVPEGTEMGQKTYAAKDFEFQLPPGVEVDKTVLREEVRVELAKRKTDLLPIDLE